MDPRTYIHGSTKEHEMSNPYASRQRYEFGEGTAKRGVVITPPAPRMAYSYVRFSHEKQAQGDSVRRQVAMARDYAARSGLVLDESVNYEDLGVSAWTGENRTAGMLGAFLQAVKDGTIKPGSVLLVEQLDRISRQTARRAARALEDIVEAGVSVVTLDDGKEYTAAMLDDPLTFITVVLSFMRAHDESQQKSRRVKAAWSNRKAKARDSFFVIAETAPGWIRTIGKLGDRDRRFELIPEHAATVQRMADMCVAGKGMHSIARELNLDGVQCFGGGQQWHDDGIRRVLSNPAIVGVLHTGNGQPDVDGYFPAAISREQWEDIRAIRNGRLAPKTRVANEIVNPLAGLARCAICGGSMTRVFKGAKAKAGKPKLVCQAAKTGKADHGYHAMDLESVVWALTNALPQILVEAPSGNAEIDDEIAMLRHQLEATGDEIERLVDAIRQRGTSAAISESLTAVEADKRALEAELGAAEERASAASPRAVERRRADLLEALDSGATAGDLNVKLRGVFEALIPDHSTGRMALRWIGGQACDREVMFAWREAEA
jgi:DNA invertase Pin-like site-specific DNA recombinase